jgi:hypothetical protein
LWNYKSYHLALRVCADHVPDERPELTGNDVSAAQAICQSSNESVVNCAQYLYDNGTAFDTQTYAYTGTTGAAFTAVAQITSGDPALSITQYAMPTGTTAVLPSRRGVLAVLPEPTAALAA